MSLEKTVTDRSGSTYEQHSNRTIGLIEWTDMCHAMNKKMPLEVAQAIFWMHDKNDTGLMSIGDFGNAMKYASLRATAVTVLFRVVAFLPQNPH